MSNSVCFHVSLGSRKRPQNRAQAVTSAPRQQAKVIPTLPDYDGGSDTIPSYKPTKGVGSSSGLFFIRF